MSAQQKTSSSAATIGELDIKITVDNDNHVLVAIPTTTNPNIQSILDKIVASLGTDTSVSIAISASATLPGITSQTYLPPTPTSTRKRGHSDKENEAPTPTKRARFADEAVPQVTIKTEVDDDDTISLASSTTEEWTGPLPLSEALEEYLDDYGCSQATGPSANYLASETEEQMIRRDRLEFQAMCRVDHEFGMWHWEVYGCAPERELCGVEVLELAYRLGEVGDYAQ